MTAAPGHERAVLADGSYQLSQMWGQLTGSGGPPFDMEGHCAEGTAGEGLFPACDSTHSCNSSMRLMTCAQKWSQNVNKNLTKDRDNEGFAVAFVTFAVGKLFDAMQDAKTGAVMWEGLLAAELM